MKYSGHESFSVRKNWLQKGIQNIESFKKSGKEGELEAMDRLGLGRNMVKSLRFWLKACGVTNDEPKKKIFELSPLGKIVSENDPYIQESGTLCLLHYNLAANKESATSWYFLFNEFNMTEFSEDDFCRALEKWDEMNGEKKAAFSSFQKDFDCIRHTYIGRSRRAMDLEEDPESNMDSPFSELRLLEQNEKGEVKKACPLKNAISPLVLYAIILKMIEKNCEEKSEANMPYEKAKGGSKTAKAEQEAKNFWQAEIKLSSLLNGKYSPGKAFNMDSILLMNILGELENKNCLQIVRTAGLDVVRLKKRTTYEECVKEYYGEFENE